MKKALFIIVCLLCLLCSCALAQEAQDITENCTFAVSNNAGDMKKMFDGKYTTKWVSSRKGYLEITAPENEPMHGLYVSWSHYITAWRIEAKDENGNWVSVYETEDQFYNQYIPLEGGYSAIRMQCLSPDNDHALHISELKVLGAGEVPSWVQQWKNFTGKADLVLIATDPGDEYLFFGGLIPHYVAQGKEVMLCVIINTAAQYKNELLNGLWHCGMTNYPYIAYFKPNLSMSYKEQYSIWGEVQFVRHVTRIVRIYDPDVLVTHSRDGENGDGGHKVCADASIRAIRLAVDDQYDIGYGLKLYGNWALPKLYLHAPRTGEIVLDFNQPLDFYGGKTAQEVAAEAYAMQSYQKRLAKTLTTNGAFNGAAYDLQYSAVGPDVMKNDFFENIQ